jgi:hypothetical protein
MFQVIEHLPSKHKAPSSSPNTNKIIGGKKEIRMFFVNKNKRKTVLFLG